MEKTLDDSVVVVVEWKSAECSCEELADEERESSRKREQEDLDNRLLNRHNPCPC